MKIYDTDFCLVNRALVKTDGQKQIIIMSKRKMYVNHPISGIYYHLFFTYIFAYFKYDTKRYA